MVWANLPKLRMAPYFFRCIYERKERDIRLFDNTVVQRKRKERRHREEFS